jgi:hypothetical protein
MSTSPENSEKLLSLAEQETLNEKRADRYVEGLEEESRSIKDAMAELSKESSKYSPEELQGLKRYLQDEAVALDFRIRKSQRTKEFCLGALPSTREERSTKLEKLISMEAPLSYAHYLERRIASLERAYNETMAQYNQLKNECADALKKAGAAKENGNVDMEQKYSQEARVKEEEMIQKRFFIQNNINMDVYSVGEEIEHVEKHILGKLPATAQKERNEMKQILDRVHKKQLELESNTQKNRLSSEDKIALYFSK